MAAVILKQVKPTSVQFLSRTATDFEPGPLSSHFRSLTEPQSVQRPRPTTGAKSAQRPTFLASHAWAAAAAAVAIYVIRPIGWPTRLA